MGPSFDVGGLVFDRIWGAGLPACERLRLFDDLAGLGVDADTVTRDSFIWEKAGTEIARDPPREASLGFDEKSGGTLGLPGAEVDGEGEIGEDVPDRELSGLALETSSSASVVDMPLRDLPRPPLLDPPAPPRPLPRPRLRPLKALPGSPILPQRGDVLEEPDALRVAIKE